MDLSLLLPAIGLIFTVVSKLLLLYSTTDKTSTLKMKSFSAVRVTQRGSQHYMEKPGYSLCKYSLAEQIAVWPTLASPSVLMVSILTVLCGC